MFHQASFMTRTFDLEVHIDTTTISNDARLSIQSDHGSMDADLSMFTLYAGTTKGLLFD